MAANAKNSSFPIEPNQKLLLIGDSVTDCDRARPVGEGLFNALGNGYVRDIDSILQAAMTAHPVRVVNMGTSGNTVRDLKARWQTDVLDQKPDWLSVMIGINDVWRQFDTPLQPENGVPLEEYETTLNELLSFVRPMLKGLVLMTPFYIEDIASDRMRSRMDEYGEAVKRTAERHEAIFVDTQAVFNRALKYRHSASIAWDRVHPNAAGHMMLAKAFLDALDFEW
jgi:lysophospholipase L1-like esterase